MVQVNLWAGLRAFVDGNSTVEVEAKTVGEMLDALARDYPGLGDIIEEGISVSVDGEIVANAQTAPVGPESEVFLLQKLAGG